MSEETAQYPPIPADDLSRSLKLARPESDESLPHIGLVGNTYTVTVSGEDTNGRFSVMDMFIAPGGGPPPHRHDFEETFILLDGELEATFRGSKIVLRAGETVNIPANSPHRFVNTADTPARILCICSPAGAEQYFAELGASVATRTTLPPPLSAEEQVELRQKVAVLSAKYGIELLKEA
jgi:quercetin dioxygenase-like cupin family protein